MFNHPWIVLAYSVALLGLGYLISGVVRSRSSRRDKAVTAETGDTLTDAETPDAQGAEQTADTAPAAGENGLAAPLIPGPTVEAPEVPIPGSELRYYKPFGPSDSIFDVWQKLQSFVSTERPTVRLLPNDDTRPLITGNFCPDGTLHHSRAAFLQEFENKVRSSAGPSAWRAVRTVSSFGIPSRLPEGGYHFFTGTLVMELKGVEVLGLKFAVSAKFEPNLGLIPGHFSHLTEYLHCEMQSGDDKKKLVSVGFPWVLTGVTLYCDDPRLDQDASTITAAILDKYTKYVKQDRVLMPTREDTTRKISLINDEFVVIVIQDGSFRTKVRDGRFLKIEYSPVPQGPLNELSAGDVEFVKFAREIVERSECDTICITSEPEAVLVSPF